MEGLSKRLARVLVAMLVLAVVIPSLGCIVGLPAQIGWMIRGLKTPAEYDGLKGERVAIICYESNNSGPEQSMRLLTNRLHFDLGSNVKNIELVTKNEISNHSDHRSLSERRILEIGRAVRADKVLAVKVHSLDLYDGATLYKGEVAYTVTIYDMNENGRQVWATSRREFEFPKHGGVPVIDTNQDHFEQRFIDQFGLRVGRLFYAFDAIEDYADDDIVIFE